MSRRQQVHEAILINKANPASPFDLPYVYPEICSDAPDQQCRFVDGAQCRKIPRPDRKHLSSPSFVSPASTIAKLFVLDYDFEGKATICPQMVTDGSQDGNDIFVSQQSLKGMSCHVDEIKAKRLSEALSVCLDPPDSLGSRASSRYV